MATELFLFLLFLLFLFYLSGIPREILFNLVTAPAFRQPTRAITMRSEIEGLQHGIISDRLLRNIPFAFEYPEVLAIHHYEITTRAGKDVVTFPGQAISLVSLTHRFAETEIGKELLKDIHNLTI